MYRLGRRSARYTAKSVQRYHVMQRALNALGEPPAESPDWVAAVMKQLPGGWGMDGNDTFGDCVIADCAHQEMLRTANVGTIWIPTLTQVLELYAYFQGYTGDQTNLQAIEDYLADNDNGCDELTVIQYLTRTGWGGRKLDGSANLDPTQLDQLKWAVCIFGASRLGLNLPDSAQTQFEAGEPWDYVPGAQLEGGHDVPLVQYNGNQYGVVTWGKLQPVTEAFLTAKYPDGTPYLEEAHAELGADWVNQAGTCPAGLDLTKLVADLSAITDHVPPPKPVPTPPSPPPDPSPMSKWELAYLLEEAAKADVSDGKMTVQQMAFDISSICGRVK